MAAGPGPLHPARDLDKELEWLPRLASRLTLTIPEPVAPVAGPTMTRNVAVALMAILTVGAIVLLPSPRARGWAKVKLAKHLFEHRYDYRTEWLRFTETLGRELDG